MSLTNQEREKMTTTRSITSPLQRTALRTSGRSSTSNPVHVSLCRRSWKVILTVPVIRLLPGERNHDRVLAHKEEDVYIAAAPLLLRQFATIMLDTGMRPEGVCRMRWENVHLEPVNGSRFGYVHNPSGKTKWAKRNLSLTCTCSRLT